MGCVTAIRYLYTVLRLALTQALPPLPEPILLILIKSLFFFNTSNGFRGVLQNC